MVRETRNPGAGDLKRKYELLPGQSGFGDGSAMSDTQHTDEEQLTADAPRIIWTTGSQYIRKDEYDRLTREREELKRDIARYENGRNDE